MASTNITEHLHNALNESVDSNINYLIQSQIHICDGYSYNPGWFTRAKNYFTNPKYYSFIRHVSGSTFTAIESMDITYLLKRTLNFHGYDQNQCIGETDDDKLYHLYVTLLKTRPNYTDIFKKVGSNEPESMFLNELHVLKELRDVPQNEVQNLVQNMQWLEFTNKNEVYCFRNILKIFNKTDKILLSEVTHEAFWIFYYSIIENKQKQSRFCDVNIELLSNLVKELHIEPDNNIVDARAKGKTILNLSIDITNANHISIENIKKHITMCDGITSLDQLSPLDASYFGSILTFNDKIDSIKIEDIKSNYNLSFCPNKEQSFLKFNEYVQKAFNRSIKNLSIDDLDAIKLYTGVFAHNAQSYIDDSTIDTAMEYSSIVKINVDKLPTCNLNMLKNVISSTDELYVDAQCFQYMKVNPCFMTRQNVMFTGNIIEALKTDDRTNKIEICRTIGELISQFKYDNVLDLNESEIAKISLMLGQIGINGNSSSNSIKNISTQHIKTISSNILDYIDIRLKDLLVSSVKGVSILYAYSKDISQSSSTLITNLRFAENKLHLSQQSMLHKSFVTSIIELMKHIEEPNLLQNKQDTFSIVNAIDVYSNFNTTEEKFNIFAQNIVNLIEHAAQSNELIKKSTVIKYCAEFSHIAKHTMANTENIISRANTALQKLHFNIKISDLSIGDIDTILTIDDALSKHCTEPCIDNDSAKHIENYVKAKYAEYNTPLSATDNTCDITQLLNYTLYLISAHKHRMVKAPLDVAIVNTHIELLNHDVLLPLHNDKNKMMEAIDAILDECPIRMIMEPNDGYSSISARSYIEAYNFSCINEIYEEYDTTIIAGE